MPRSLTGVKEVGAALLIIDVQQGLDDPSYGVRNNLETEQRMAGTDFKEEVRPAPGEPVFCKQVNSAFIGTALEDYLRSRGIGELFDRRAPGTC